VIILWQWFLTSENFLYFLVLRAFSKEKNKDLDEIEEIYEKYFMSVELLIPKIPKSDENRVMRDQVFLDYYLENVSDAIQDGIERIRGRINTCLILGLLGTIFGLAEASLRSHSDNIFNLQEVIKQLPLIFMVTGSGALSAVLSTLLFLNKSIGFSELVENKYKERIINLRYEISKSLKNSEDKILFELEKMNETIDNIFNNLSKNTTQAFADITKTLVHNVETKLASVVKSLVDSSLEFSKNIVNVQKISEKITENVDNLANKTSTLFDNVKLDEFVTHAHRISENLEKIARNIKESFGEIEGIFQEVKEDLEKFPEDIKKPIGSLRMLFESINKDVADIHDGVTGLKEKIVGSLDSLTENLTKEVNRSLEKQDENNKRTEELLGELKRLNDSISDIYNSFGSLNKMFDNNRKTFKLFVEFIDEFFHYINQLKLNRSEIVGEK
jgi:predicted  nucleic acid-binding Zn-ribbon protein